MWESAAELPRFFPPHWKDIQRVADSADAEDSEDETFPSGLSLAEVHSPGACKPGQHLRDTLSCDVAAFSTHSSCVSPLIHPICSLKKRRVL